MGGKRTIASITMRLPEDVLLLLLVAGHDEMTEWCRFYWVVSQSNLMRFAGINDLLLCEILLIRDSAPMMVILAMDYRHAIWRCDIVNE